MPILPKLSVRIERIVRKVVQQEEQIIHRRAFGITPLPQLIKEGDAIVGKAVRDIMREIENP